MRTDRQPEHPDLARTDCSRVEAGRQQVLSARWLEPTHSVHATKASISLLILKTVKRFMARLPCHYFRASILAGPGSGLEYCPLRQRLACMPLSRTLPTCSKETECWK